MPMPPLEGKVAVFMNGIMESGYFLPVLKGVEVICGLMLLAGLFVPLALVVLAPIVLQIFLFHLFLAPEGLVMALVIGLIQIYLSFVAEPYATPIKSLFRNAK